MDKKLKSKAITVIIIALVAGALVFYFWQNERPGKFDDFARCLQEKGAKFYGAFWCSHCQNQKSMFGHSAKYLNYIECSTADSKGQLPVCNEAKVQAYPTWKFQDGSVEQGELTLNRLSEKTGCQLPQ